MKKKISNFAKYFVILVVFLSIFAASGSYSVVFAQTSGLTSQDFDQFNPLSNSLLSAQLKTPGGIINQVLVFAFPAAGIILFLMIVWGGFEMVYSATSSKGKDAGKQRITAAIIGFILLFSAYWLAQLVQVIFGVKFLN
jgi:hypothetical protein